MGVNIWVTDATDGEKRFVGWGNGSYAYTEEKADRRISVDGKHYQTKETPAEIAALVAAEERKQARERIAAMALQGYLANSRIDRWLPHEYA